MQFTYVDNFTGYMRVVAQYLQQNYKTRKPRILDLPAGAGLFANALGEIGFDVIKADICGLPGFEFVDMEEPLPFESASFDVITCLEGVEHLVNPMQLLAELSRIAKPGALIVISTPNIGNLWSRLTFLFTGTFYQFRPNGARQRRGRHLDCGHIAPFTPLQLTYLMGNFGATLREFRVDRFKKAVLLPLYLLMFPWMALFSHRVSRNTETGTYAGVHNMVGFLTSPNHLFGRSQILFFEKTK